MIKFFKNLGSGNIREEVGGSVEVGAGLKLNQSSDGRPRIDLDTTAGTVGFVEVDGSPNFLAQTVRVPNGALTEPSTGVAFIDFYVKSQLYTKTEADGRYALTSHSHNDLYYTEAEVNSLLDAKAPLAHQHDDRYYTESEITGLLTGKADSVHGHSWGQISGAPVYTTRWPTWDEVTSKPSVLVSNTDVSLNTITADRLQDKGNTGYYVDPANSTALRGAGDVHLDVGKNLWIGNNADSGNRIRVHCATDGNGYIDFSGNLSFRPNSSTSTYMDISSAGNVTIRGALNVSGAFAPGSIETAGDIVSTGGVVRDTYDWNGIAKLGHIKVGTGVPNDADGAPEYTLYLRLV